MNSVKILTWVITGTVLYYTNPSKRRFNEVLQNRIQNRTNSFLSGLLIRFSSEMGLNGVTIKDYRFFSLALLKGVFSDTDVIAIGIIGEWFLFI